MFYVVFKGACLHLNEIGKMETKKILYYIFTAIMSCIFLFSAFMYFTKYEMVTGFFEMLNFPTWLVLPLAIAKVLGILTIWIRPNRLLLEWAYAGFFFDAVFAFTSHAVAGHVLINLSLLAIIVTVLSRITYGQVFLSSESNKIEA